MHKFTQRIFFQMLELLKAFKMEFILNQNKAFLDLLKKGKISILA